MLGSSSTDTYDISLLWVRQLGSSIVRLLDIRLHETRLGSLLERFCPICTVGFSAPAAAAIARRLGMIASLFPESAGLTGRNSV